MGFHTGAYATVWEVTPGSGNYTDVRLSISKKDKNTGLYEQDFSGRVRFVADAHRNIGGLKERDRIKIGDCDVTTTYNKEKKIGYTNYVIFTFEFADGGGVTKQTAKTMPPNFIEDGDDDGEGDLPF
jgi:hypothetical protein